MTLKLKTGRFRLITRSHGLPAPTRLAETLYRTALPLLAAELAASSAPYRLIGIGCTDLAPGDLADPPDLLDPDRERDMARSLGLDYLHLPVTQERLGPDLVDRFRDEVADCHGPVLVRERTDKLDAVGNTTAAIGKGRGFTPKGPGRPT